ncbi:hypothetical protein JTE90_022954 [Oedothorax gibbosus]|uniref:Protein C10 n=1 Tax=Oedothorax gibbosus TaxID=931172 RepID=A0AAV6V9N4_9ARAC|nr:hypothetical protein JTE90_022954 [Oedothorax gibbosus]
MLSVENAKAALRDVIAALTSDPTSRLNEAKNNSGNDMLMHMQLVFPLATQIQQDIIQNYGFPPDREGLLQFTQIIKIMEKDNEEILQMNEHLKSLLIPPLVLPYSQSV